MFIDSIPVIAFAAAAILFGFIGLIWSADRFVEGAAAFALNLGVKPMIIGLTVVSFGTSAPEILVSLSASLDGAGDIAVGNALGSNIANIGLVLAITALIARIPVQAHILKDELPVLLIISALAGWFLRDAHLDRIEGFILLAALIPAISYMIWAKRGQLDEAEAEEEEDIQEMSTAAASFWFGLGLGLLILSAKVLVWGAVTTATYFDVSPLIIGLTVLAIGTSLPELAASIISALKGHHDIALGNIIGSNLFNLLAVMSIPGIVIPTQEYGSVVFSRDYTAMAGFTVLIALFAGFAFLRKSNKPGFGRTAGCILLLSYGAYCYLLFQATLQS